jgi:pre-mRNA-splicing factor 18
MDGLLAEINAKRKELETDVQAGPSKKYMRRAEVEAAKEEEDRRRRDKLRKEREEREAAKAAKARSDVSGVVLSSPLPSRCYGVNVVQAADNGCGCVLIQADSARNTSLARLAASPAPGSMGGTPEPSSSSSVVEKETFNISPEECIRRLRSKGQPIRLFGETDKDRRLRLRALELLEERGGGRENEFRKTVADLERGRAEKEAAGVGAGSGSGNASAGAKSGGGGGGKEEKKVEVGLIDMGLVKTDPNKLYPLIYYALKVSRNSVRSGTRARKVARLRNGKSGWTRDQVRTASTTRTGLTRTEGS